MGNWANVGLKHLANIMWETKAELKMCVRAIYSLFFPSTNSKNPCSLKVESSKKHMSVFWLHHIVIIQEALYKFLF